MMIVCSILLKPASAATTFTDLEQATWAEDSINYLVYMGVIDGVGNNKFNPMGNLTRGEAAKIVALALPLQVDLDEKTDFADAHHHWASPYIRALQTQAPGVITGFPDGTFHPNGSITREQMAKMIANAYSFEEKKEWPSEFTFHDVSGWATEYIDLLASHSILYGRTQNLFAPKDHVNRAEAAAIIHRAEAVYHLTPREFDEKEIVEQGGVKFEVMFNQTDQKLYVNTKLTNISEESIPYIGFNGCDSGISVNLFAKIDSQSVLVGTPMWNPLLSCPQIVRQHTLNPGETIQTFEVFSTPKEDLKETHVVKISLKNGVLDSTNPYEDDPIEVEVSLERE